MTVRRFFLGLALLAFAALFNTGCGVIGAQVWERDVLSKPEMNLDEPALDHAMDDHIYFSKEASSGGRSFGGGGCGCN